MSPIDGNAEAQTRSHIQRLRSMTRDLSAMAHRLDELCLVAHCASGQLASAHDAMCRTHDAVRLALVTMDSWLGAS